MVTEEEKILIEIIRNNFNLPEVADEEISLQKIRALLIDQLDFLIDHDFEKLLWILYHIDVSEEKAKAALAVNTIQKHSEVLADLIIKRQIEKTKTRLEYREEHKDDPGDL